jgi:hypothetical protein
MEVEKCEFVSIAGTCLIETDQLVQCDGFVECDRKQTKRENNENDHD